MRLGVMGFGEENQKGEVPFSSHHIMYQHGLSMTTLVLIISLRLCLSGFSAKKLLPIPPTPFHILLFGRKSLFSWECVPFLWLLVCRINFGCILVIINVKCGKSWFCFVFCSFPLMRTINSVSEWKFLCPNIFSLTESLQSVLYMYGSGVTEIYR